MPQVRVNSKAFGKLIESAAKAGRVKDAEDWLEQMKRTPGVKADIVAYGAVLDACSKVGDICSS